MDLKKTGVFLSELRREQKLTQEQLGERIGVTNKTISRWENGNYMPSVEMLQALSELYNVSINELLSGERLSHEKYQQRAEENMKAILKESSFSLKEKIEFYKKKWRKDHLLSTVLCWIGIAALLAAGFIWDNKLQAAALILALVYYIIQYNRMMAYVEERAYNGKGSDYHER